MSTLALVYVDATKHVVSSVLVQSGYSTPPKVEELVGSGPRVRDPKSVASAINLDAQAVALKVLVLDTGYFANDRATYYGLLNTPLSYCLQLQDPSNPKSPLIPALGQPKSGLVLTPDPLGVGTATIKLSSALGLGSTALQMLVLVQRGSVDSSPPMVSPPNSVGPTTATSSLQVTLGSKDAVMILIETWQPVIQTLP